MPRERDGRVDDRSTEVPLGAPPASRQLLSLDSTIPVQVTLHADRAALTYKVMPSALHGTVKLVSSTCGAVTVTVSIVSAATAPGTVSQVIGEGYPLTLPGTLPAMTGPATITIDVSLSELKLYPRCTSANLELDDFATTPA